MRVSIRYNTHVDPTFLNYVTNRQRFLFHCMLMGKSFYFVLFDFSLFGNTREVFINNLHYLTLRTHISIVIELFIYYMYIFRHTHTHNVIELNCNRLEVLFGRQVYGEVYFISLFLCVL